MQSEFVRDIVQCTPYRYYKRQNPDDKTEERVVIDRHYLRNILTCHEQTLCFHEWLKMEEFPKEEIDWQNIGTQSPAEVVHCKNCWHYTCLWKERCIIQGGTHGTQKSHNWQHWWHVYCIIQQKHHKMHGGWANSHLCPTNIFNPVNENLEGSTFKGVIFEDNLSSNKNDDMFLFIEPNYLLGLLWYNHFASFVT